MEDNRYYPPDPNMEEKVLIPIPEHVKKNIAILDEMKIESGAIYENKEGEEFRVFMFAFPQGAWTSQSVKEPLPMQNPKLKPEQVVFKYHTLYASSTTGDCFINCGQEDSDGQLNHFQLSVPQLVDYTGWTSGKLPVVRIEDTTPGLTEADKRRLRDHVEEKKAEFLGHEEVPESGLAEEPSKSAKVKTKRGRHRR